MSRVSEQVTQGNLKPPISPNKMGGIHNLWQIDIILNTSFKQWNVLENNNMKITGDR